MAIKRPGDGDGGAVQRVDEVRSLFPFAPEADVQPPRLVVGAVRGAGDFTPFAPFAASRHPGLEVELAVRRPAQVAGGRVDDAVGNPQLVEDLALQLAQLLVHGVALIRQREGEHLDLRELVNAVDAARGPAVGTRLGAEAVADAAQLDRQRIGVERLVGVEPAERDLRGPDQAEFGVFDAVDLRLRPARQETDAVQNPILGEVGRDERA